MYTGENYTPNQLPSWEEMEKALEELVKLSEEEASRRTGRSQASFPSRPFMTSAEGVFRCYLDQCPVSKYGLMLKILTKQDLDLCHHLGRSLLISGFKTKLSSARTNDCFVSFIYKYFEMAIKRWS